MAGILGTDGQPGLTSSDVQVQAPAKLEALDCNCETPANMLRLYTSLAKQQWPSQLECICRLNMQHEEKHPFHCASELS